MRYGDLLSKRQVFTTREPSAPAPLVTVVMPTYCRHSEGMLVRCLNSVLQQTFTDFEFIVMDDGSTDGTEKVLHETALRDPRLVHIRLERNSGLPGVLINEAVRMGRGQYIAYMFDDNEWFPQALESMVNAARTSGADLVHGKAYVVQADGQQEEYGALPSGYESLAAFNTIPNGAVLITHAFVDRYGLYDPHYVIGRLYDWELWLRARKMGARFAYVDEFITTEYGPTSSSSLGNAVNLNFPISAAYLQDGTRRVNAARLKPDSIDDYDIFDPEMVLPYVRSMGEWDIFEDAVYKPLLKRHPEYEYLPPLRHNRRFDRQYQKYQLNPVFEIFNERKRTLILSNRVTLLVDDLRQALQADGRRIVVLAPQWSGKLYNVEDLDEIVIVDSVVNWVLDSSLQGVDLKKPIIIVHQADVSQPIANTYGSLQNAWQSSLNVKQSLVAFPGISIDSKIKSYRDHLHSLADLTISSQPDGDDLALNYLPNCLKSINPPCTIRERNLYVGDFTTLSESTRRDVRKLAEQGWRIWLFPWSKLPEEWSAFSRLSLTSDTLPTSVLSAPEGIWTAVPEVSRLHEGFDHACLLEELLIHGGMWIEISLAILNPNDLEVECLSQDLSNELDRQSVGLCMDARWRQWRNIIDGVAFQHMVVRQRGKRSAQQSKGQIFINSQAIGGSEAIGIQIAAALYRIGVHLALSVPANVNITPGGLETINQRLEGYGLAPADCIDYGSLVYFLSQEHIDEKRLEEFLLPMRTWLQNHNLDWVLTSGIIPEPIVAASPDRVCFTSAYQPWDYPLNRLAFLREFLDGGISDSFWAASKWQEILQPPFTVARSWVEPDYFKIKSEIPSKLPINIAVIGALQPRKRQLEAILAVQKLLEKGYDLKLNLYGYEFPGFSDYINRMKKIVKDSSLLQECITFHGFVNIPPVLSNNHIVLSTSIDESFPGSLLQSMAVGLIPVATQAGGTDEMIEDNISGFLIHGFSLYDVVEALERSIQSRSHWPEISTRARRWVADNCSEQVFTSKLLSMMIQATEIWMAPGSRYYVETRPTVGSTEIAVPQPEYTRKFLTLAEENRSRPGPELNSAPLIYHLKPERDGWCGFRLRFGTYYHQPAGSLQVEVRKPGSRHPIRSIQVNLERIHDNEWLELLFEPIRRSLGRDFEVHISAQITSGRLVVYEVLPAPLLVHMVVLRAGQVNRRYLKTRLPIRRSGLAILPVYHREDAND
jgi:glycosyltransferase involved in cell wall biosynthesis